MQPGYAPNLLPEEGKLDSSMKPQVVDATKYQLQEFRFRIAVDVSRICLA